MQSSRESSYIKYGFLAVVAVILLVFFKNLVATVSAWFGLDKVQKENKTEEDRQDTLDTNVQNQVISKPSTKVDAEWLLIANNIYNDLRYTSLDDNHKDAVYQLARVQNDTDVYKLIQQFGKRQEYAFGVPVGDLKDLPTMVISNLNLDELAVVNGNLTRKKIKFKY